jgi:stalled ribosome rescue protein Dom34
MKKGGVWLDKRMAYIVAVDDDKKDTVEIVVSKVEQRNEILKAYRDKVKQGFAETIKDRKLLEYNKQELKRYFKEIIQRLVEFNEIVIYGPSQTAPKLFAEMKQLNPHVAKNVKEVKKANSMTKNQIRALIRDYYP